MMTSKKIKKITNKNKNEDDLKIKNENKDDLKIFLKNNTNTTKKN